MSIHNIVETQQKTATNNHGLKIIGLYPVSLTVAVIFMTGPDKINV